VKRIACYIIISIISVAALALSRARADDAAANRYQIDDKAGELTLSVKKKGALKAFAHDHEIAALVYTGTVVWVAGAPETSSVTLEIATKDLTVQDPQLSADDRKSVQEKMAGADVLDVAKFPRITFVSSFAVAREKDSAGRTPLSVMGKLTLHGVARQTTIEVLLEEKNGVLTVTGEHSFKQSDHGMEPYSTGFGSIAVQDVVTLKFKIVARKSS